MEIVSLEGISDWTMSNCDGFANGVHCKAIMLHCMLKELMFWVEGLLINHVDCFGLHGVELLD